MENKTDETPIVIDIETIKQKKSENEIVDGLCKWLEQKILCIIVTAFIVAVILVFTQAITSDE